MLYTTKVVYNMHVTFVHTTKWSPWMSSYHSSPHRWSPSSIPPSLHPPSPLYLSWILCSEFPPSFFTFLLRSRCGLGMERCSWSSELAPDNICPYLPIIRILCTWSLTVLSQFMENSCGLKDVWCSPLCGHCHLARDWSPCAVGLILVNRLTHPSNEHYWTCKSYSSMPSGLKKEKSQEIWQACLEILPQQNYNISRNIMY